MYSQKLILASQSPRRAQLLRLVGFEFDIMPSSIDESEIVDSDPACHVRALSLAKAMSVGARVAKGIIVGSDTVVILDDEILGKPRDEVEAKDMLHRLAGRTHQVYTGFTLLEKPTNRQISDYDMTRVHFRDLADWEIDRYVATQNPMDKAGAYGIQDQSAVFADRIEGCFYNVVGFPLSKFYTAMIKFIADSQG
ncbi:septum formation inhibitor Maf [candidate division KSB1 bacterium]|nr:septum formation inhibitor Maf [candidate division KSB1 bacterium]RQW08058.1 MAG: septum formation inhibitor Maf [candidate division KSB1 bacterium]